MKQSDNYTELCSYMAKNVNQGDSVDVWNTVRQEANILFTGTTISRLDASGYIKEFYLSPSADRWSHE